MHNRLFKGESDFKILQNATVVLYREDLRLQTNPDENGDFVFYYVLVRNVDILTVKHFDYRITDEKIAKEVKQIIIDAYKTNKLDLQ